MKMVQTSKTVDRSTGRARRSAVATILTGAMLSMVALAPAAHAADTTTTFSLSAGALNVTAPASAAITDGAAGNTDVSGSLGTVQVTDERGGIIGWVASASSGSFTGDQPTTPTVIANTEVDYLSGTATASSGVVTPVPGSAVTPAAMGSPVTAFSGTVVLGNNSVSWAPTVTVNLPSDALAGAYSGTITHSVL